MAGRSPEHGGLYRTSTAGGKASASEERAGQTPLLELTGERTLPGIAAENYWFRRHEAAYTALLPFCQGATVLEAGCGEGYGADRIAGVARCVVGVDYDAATVAHVAAAYPRVRVLRANLVALPVSRGAVDVVAGLQVIEHLWDQPGFLRDCHRVLRPAGTLLLTTPNRLTFSPGNGAQNPFHARELSPDELLELLTEHGFTPSRMLGLRHGRRLRRLDERYGSFVDAQLAGPASTWHRALRRDVSGVRASDFVLRRADLDRCLDLVVVANRDSGR
jgi:SAM-dependent methyltransferase